MKLLIILPSTQRGGAEEYVLKITKAALQAEVEIQVAFPSTSDTASLINDFNQQNIKYHPLDIGNVEGSKLALVRASLFRLLRIGKLLLTVKPDVVLLNLPAHHLGFIILWACGLLKVPTAVVFHLIPFSISFSQSKLRAYHWAKARNQAWITISDYNRRYLAQEFNLAPEEFYCIYNGIEQRSPIIKSQTEQNKLRPKIKQELGLAETSQLLLTVARLHPQKGHDYLIPIIPEIIAKFPQVQFVWVGDGEYQAHLKNLLREYKVETQVTFLGYREDIWHLLSAADLFLFPSYQEGLPFAILEAMVSGLPIVASDTGGIPEMITHSSSGLLFSTGDSQQLQQQLDWALTHPAEMASMAIAAKVAVQKFSEAKMLEDTWSVLDFLYKS
ncbi:MAG: glycosyltransferase family 4 protein [Cyanobacteria bacterium P01_G01_bin.39]